MPHATRVLLGLALFVVALDLDSEARGQVRPPAETPAPKPARKAEQAPQAKTVTLRNETGRVNFILAMVQDGKTVAKGELVCELESERIREELLAQEIVIPQAEQDVITSKLLREAAELAIKEYMEGAYKIKVGSLRVALAQAEAAHEVTVEHLEKLRNNGQNTKINETLIKRAELEEKRARLAMDKAALALKTFNETEHPRRLKELEAKLTEARAAETEKRKASDEQKARKKSLEQQIAACELRAPIAGQVRYIQPTSEDEPMIGTGGDVNDRQPILRIVPEGAVDDEDKDQADDGEPAEEDNGR